jgi:hypothetical protein
LIITPPYYKNGINDGIPECHARLDRLQSQANKRIHKNQPSRIESQKGNNKHQCKEKPRWMHI